MPHLFNRFFPSTRFRSTLRTRLGALTLVGLVGFSVNLSAGPMSVMAAPAASVRIQNPLSNQTYSGVMNVQASATNPHRVSYAIDGGTERPLSYDAGAMAWTGSFDTRTLVDGAHNLDVVNHGADGTTTADRAWSIRVRNAAAPPIAIANPLSNQHFAGAIQIQARGTGFESVAYTVDGGMAVPMSYQATAQLWSAALNSTQVSSGSHNVDVVGTTSTGGVSTDRAWSVVFAALPSSTPQPTPVRQSSPTPSPTLQASPPRPTSQVTLTPVPIVADPPSIVIQNPLSNGTYAGSVVVQASATNARRVSYDIDGGPGTTMTRDPATGLWSAALDSRTLTNGRHNVTVSATDGSNRPVPDRAWNVEFVNSVVATPVSSSAYVFGLIGDDTNPATLSTELAAGVRAKIVRLSWKDYLPDQSSTNATYISAKRAQLAQLRQAGLGVILDLGLQDTPSWVHQNFPDSYYVNQYGERYGDPAQPDQGDANLVFNPAIRLAAADYLGRVFADLGTDFQAVRLGGGRWGELTYPPASYNGRANTYWAFDTNAQRLSPVPAWRPGQAQPNSEARAFANAYMDSLVDYQNWQVATVRRAYTGSLMMLYPSWGIRPGELDAAVAGSLSGSSSAEINGEVQRGFDVARQIHALSDPGVVVTTTWLDADASQDAGADPRYWSPIKYLSSLAGAHPASLRKFGENTGQGTTASLGLAAAQMQRFNLMGMAWFTESELLGGRYATLADYAAVVGSAL